MPRFDKIVCPIDFDANSLLALRLAIELTQEHQGTLYLLYVVALPPGPEVALPFARMESDARRRLERLAREKIGRKVRYEVNVMMGDPAVEILQMAQRRRARLIVMATHGRKGMRRLLLGSVAERVVREAPCPVLTVRPRESRTASVRSSARTRKRTERRPTAPTQS